MKLVINTIGFTLAMLYVLSWTNVLWHMTGYKQLTMWYWIAWFGNAIQ